jgi:putative transposase
MHNFHAENLRRGRVSIPGVTYLVTTVVNKRKPLFNDYRLGRIVVNALRYHSEKGDAESLAFVIMPDHLHWLFALTGTVSLSDLISSVKGYSSRQIASFRGRNNAPIDPHEPVWQRGFYDHAVRDEEDIRSAARYLVMNPIRAEIVSNIWDYSLWDAIWIEGG